MKIEATRQEIEVAHRLLQDLKAWERMRLIIKEHGQGEVCFESVGSNSKDRLAIKIHINPYRDRTEKIVELTEINQQVRGIIRRHVGQIVEEVVMAITKAMPIPIEENQES